MRFSTGLFASLAAVQAVLSAPVATPKTPTAVGVALSVVQEAQVTLDTQKADVEDFISNDAVPFIKTSLGNIAGAVQNITTKVTPYVVGVVKPLTDDELANVPVLLGKTKALADGLKDYATTLLSGLSTESQKAIKAEISFVFALLGPAIAPIKTLATTAALQSTGATKDQINAGLADVDYAVGAALTPLLAAIAAL